MSDLPFPTSLPGAGFSVSSEEAYYDDDDDSWILFTNEEVIAVYENGRVNICRRS